jgi:hypothetical protein
LSASKTFAISNALLAPEPFQHDADLLLGGKEPNRRPPNVPDCIFRRLFLRPGFLSHLRSLRRGGSCTIFDRRKPFRLGEVVEGVGVEEQIERVGRPCDGRQSVARGRRRPAPGAAHRARSTLHSPITG